MPAKFIGKNAQFQPPTAHNPHNERSKRNRKPVRKYLIPEEKDALFRVITDKRDQAIFRLALHHGLRASEIGLININDYHPGSLVTNDRLSIERLKGSIGGDTRLVAAAALAIRNWVKKRGWAPGPLFTSRNKGPISRRRLDELMKHYCQLVNIPEEKRHFHCLKHTCATLLLSQMHESIVDVQNHLGHADIRSTMIYAKLTEQANEERAARLKNWK